MSAVPTAAPVSAAQGLAIVSGRITYRRRITTQSGPLHLTLLKLAAPDEFTAPQTIEVRSSRQLPGAIGEVWRGRVRVGGYGRSYDSTDKDTGEVYRVQTANLTLSVVEDSEL